MTSKMPARAILEGYKRTTVALDQQAKAIRAANPALSLAESYDIAIDGEDESAGESRGEAA